MQGIMSRPRTPVARTLRLIPLIAGLSALVIRAGKLATSYLLSEIPTELGGRGFALVKADAAGGPPTVYHVHVTGPDAATCDCRGHLRWGAAPGGRCKHAAAVLTLIERGGLPPAVAAPVVNETIPLREYEQWTFDCAARALAEAPAGELAAA